MSLIAELVFNNANSGRAEHMGEIKIVNDATGTSASGNYAVFYRPRPHGQWSRQMRIEGWDRSRPGWALLVEAIRVLELDATPIQESSP